MVVLMGHSLFYGQQLNDYKYLIVPAKFEGFKNENQFRTSTLVKYLFTNEGFNTVYSNNQPEELKENPCLGVRVKLIDESGLFSTKTKLSLTDCHGVLLMLSQEGKTKTKDFEQAYREAISEAFGSFRGLNTYEPKKKAASSDTESITVSFKNDIKSLEEEPHVEVNTKEDSAESEPTKQVSPPKTWEQLNSKAKGMLYAQPIEGGYQLVDATPKVVYMLKSTSAPDVFLVSKDGKNGVIYKNEGKWFIEMDEKGSKAKELNIKF